ncbi:MAG: 6-phosphogluconolactonase, partial [Pseudolabrys sp.]
MTSPTEARLEILADPEALSRRVAEWMLDLAKNKNGVFSVCLSGGSTTQQLYEHLAEPTYR